MDQEERLKHGLATAADLMTILARVTRSGVEVRGLADLMATASTAFSDIERMDSMGQTLAYNKLIEVRRALTAIEKRK